MAIGVIDRLEAVEVDQAEDERLTMTAQALQPAFQRDKEAAPVGQVGQRVTLGQMAGFGGEGLGLLAIPDRIPVRLDRENHRIADDQCDRHGGGHAGDADPEIVAKPVGDIDGDQAEIADQRGQDDRRYAAQTGQHGGEDRHHQNGIGQVLFLEVEQLLEIGVEHEQPRHQQSAPFHAVGRQAFAKIAPHPDHQ